MKETNLLHTVHKSETPAVAAAGVSLCCCCLEFYFLRPFSHLQIMPYKKFAAIPAATETRNERNRPIKNSIPVSPPSRTKKEPATVIL